MDIIGIVGEYNPFHYGHLYHLNETKKLFDDAAVVCAMSGDFVQRGEGALFDKFTRAEAACRCGVDLVLELPVKWCLSSAEKFARGAVQLLSCAGAEYLSFGSECGNIGDIEEAAELLHDRTIIEKIIKKVNEEKELSFAAARELVLSEFSPSASQIIKSPNNILAVEYVKAIQELKASIRPITVKRKGSAHDSTAEDGLLSASDIRGRFAAGESIEKFVPEQAWSVYCKAIENGRVPDRELMDSLFLSRLRMFDRDYYNALPDAQDGLGDRLFKASRECSELRELYDIAKTKKYALSRIRRVCMCAGIGLKAGDRTESIPYIRVLAANHKGRMLLNKIAENVPVPLITKAASVRKYDKKCQEMYADGVSAHDLYVLSYRDKKLRYGGQDWTTGPKIVEVV